MKRRDKRPDERLPTGSIVRWSRRRGGRIPVVCGRCGKERTVVQSHPYHRDFTGYCQKCARTRTRDVKLPNGSVIFWSRQTKHKVPVCCGQCGEERLIQKQNPTREDFTGICKRCTTNEARKDQTLDNGSVVYWSRRKGVHVPVMCGVCKSERIAHAANIRTSTFTGLCRPCCHTGERASSWKGGRITRGGYVYVKLDPDHPFYDAMATHNGYVSEHRLVMAEHIGRPLLRSEVVHHRNAVKTDNRIENLELFESARDLATERQRRNPHPGYRRVELPE